MKYLHLKKRSSSGENIASGGAGVLSYQNQFISSVSQVTINEYFVTVDRSSLFFNVINEHSLILTMLLGVQGWSETFV